MSLLFSIIIPSFNAESTIETTLESIQSQTYQNYEIVVVDGLSTDGTNRVIEKYSHYNPKVKYLSEKDNGIYDAMNKGVKMAQGDWILFLGADDHLYANDTLEKVYKTIDLNSKSRFIYGNVHTSYGNVQKYEDYTFEKLVRMNICHQSIFYHKSVFCKHSYDTSFKVFADWDLNLKVFNRKNSPLYVDEIISFFSLEGTSKDWMKHPEYLNYFSSPKKLIAKYKGIGYKISYLIKQIYKKISIK